MVGKRLLLLLAGCFLTASAALADDVGFIDCHEHPELTQVFAKARQTHETVATLPCGERFTILLYGFIFSRIQTRDGQIGYVFSNAISVDHSGTPVLRPSSTQLRAAASNPPATPTPVVEASRVATATVAEPNPAATAKLPAPNAQPAPTRAPEAASKSLEATAPVVEPNATPVTAPQPTPKQPAVAEGPSVSSKAPEAPAPVAQPKAPSQPEVAPVQPPPASVPAVSAPETSASAAPSTSTIFPRPVTVPVEPTRAPEPASSAPETRAPVTQPNPPAAAEAEPAPAEPSTPAIRPANARESWEKPNRGTRRAAVIELFGGYGFARLDSGAGTMTNLNGALGSFGWNVRPWLQLVADSSYNVTTISGTKNVLYGNHWGPRIFFHGRYPWGAVPFVEGLVGGSRADTTVSGVGGYTTSDNCLSFKVGGGLDIHPSRHFKIRLFNFDYYRTAFGANLHQNNYSASVGIVLRLFGGGAE
jgi:hypothetical protein